MSVPKPLPHCEHGRPAHLVEHGTGQLLDWHRYAYRVETRKWLGLRVCCAGAYSYTSDKYESMYACRTAMNSWRRARGEGPRTDFEALLQWLETPE